VERLLFCLHSKNGLIPCTQHNTTQHNRDFTEFSAIHFSLERLHNEFHNLYASLNSSRVIKSRWAERDMQHALEGWKIIQNFYRKTRRQEITWIWVGLKNRVGRCGMESSGSG